MSSAIVFAAKFAWRPHTTGLQILDYVAARFLSDTRPIADRSPSDRHPLIVGTAVVTGWRFVG
jgi:hypothetical protein